jgi:hypothetical protein
MYVDTDNRNVELVYIYFVRNALHLKFDLGLRNTSDTEPATSIGFILNYELNDYKSFFCGSLTFLLDFSLHIVE